MIVVSAIKTNKLSMIKIKNHLPTSKVEKTCQALLIASRTTEKSGRFSKMANKSCFQKTRPFLQLTGGSTYLCLLTETATSTATIQLPS